MKAHDVRHICFCAACGGLANDRHAVRLKGDHFEKFFPQDYDLKSHWHPGCYVEKFGEDMVFNLSRDERRKFRLCDVSSETMLRLLEDA